MDPMGLWMFGGDFMSSLRTFTKLNICGTNMFWEGAEINDQFMLCYSCERCIFVAKPESFTIITTFPESHGWVVSSTESWSFYKHLQNVQLKRLRL